MFWAVKAIHMVTVNIAQKAYKPSHC